MKFNEVPKISDVIKQLKSIKEGYGDIPLVMECVYDDGSTATNSIMLEVESMQSKDVVSVYGDEEIDYDSLPARL